MMSSARRRGAFSLNVSERAPFVIFARLNGSEKQRPAARFRISFAVSPPVCCFWRQRRNLVRHIFSETLNSSFFGKKSRKKFRSKVLDFNTRTRRHTHARKRTPGGGFFFFCCCCCVLPRKGADGSSWRQKKRVQLLFFFFFFVREKFDFYPTKTSNDDAKKKTKKTKKKRGDVFFFFARRGRRNDGAKTRPSDRELRAQTALSRRKRKSPAENLLERSQHVGVRYRLSTLTRRYFRTRD